MQTLQYRPLCPYDAPILQAMIQETDFSGLSFNRYAQSIFIATCGGHVVGFTYGHKGYGEDSNLLTIEGTYLRTAFDDDMHEQELHLAFINWARDKLQVEYYQLAEPFSSPRIQIGFSVPAQPATVLEPSRELAFV